jgi:hypothetical protein
MADEKSMKANARYRQADGGHRIAKLIQGDVLAGIPDGQDFVPPFFDPVRPHVAALRLRGETAGVIPSVL